MLRFEFYTYLSETLTEVEVHLLLQKGIHGKFA